MTIPKVKAVAIRRVPIVPEPSAAKPKPKRKPRPKRIWDNYKVVGEAQKSDRIKFVVAAAVRDGVRYINIREFYQKKSDLIWRPGRDGITIPLLVPIEKGTKIIEPYGWLINLIDETSKVAAVIDLYDEANAVYYVKKETKKNEDK